MTRWDAFVDGADPPSIQDIYRAPAHLIRRCHQISVATFANELGQYGLTPVQYASLLAIRDNPGIDQRGLGDAIAVDRSTITNVLRGLEGRGLINRKTPQENQRIKRLSITTAGEALLTETVGSIGRVQRRLLAPLSQDEQRLFLELLGKIVAVNNDQSRAPLKL